MSIVSVACCAVVFCLLIITVRQYRPEIAAVITVATGAVLLVMIIDSAAPALGTLSSAISGTAAAGYVSPVVRALGVCLVTQTAADICRDSGQQTIAARVETAGAAAVLVIALPLLTEVLSVSAAIIGR